MTKFHDFLLLFRYRGPSVPASGTLDRAAMIRGDTSSEGSGNDNFAAVNEHIVIIQEYASFICIMIV